MHARASVSLLSAYAPKGKLTFVLDLGVVMTVMREILDEPVPREWRGDVLRGVRLLHDMEYHAGRDHPGACVPEAPLRDFDEHCPDCRARHKCPSCGDLFVLHLDRECDGEEEARDPTLRPGQARRTAFIPVTIVRA